MANIRVDLDYMINDGSSVVFRSPCDCTEITGLIVYYIAADGKQTSKEFALADAHGENVGDIPHLFAENVVVKVILDVTSGMAFVQNADTNAYLEGRFAELEEQMQNTSGGSGIHIDTEPPTDPKIKVWIDTDEEPGVMLVSVKSFNEETSTATMTHTSEQVWKALEAGRLVLMNAEGLLCVPVGVGNEEQNGYTMPFAMVLDPTISLTLDNSGVLSINEA